MKKLILIVIGVMMLALLAGCVAAPAAPAEAPATEAPSETEGPAPAAQEAGKEYYFRLVTHGGDDPFWAVVKQGMEDAAALYGVRAVIDLAGSDLANQQQAFQEAVASQPDGIALVINNDEAWDKPVEDALAAGIPVIGINNDDTQGPAGNARLAYIGQNERRAGYMLGLAVLSKAKDAGVDLANAKVGFSAEVPTAAYATVRLSGIQDALDEFGVTSEVDIIDAGGIEMTKAEERITAYLLANPDVTFMFGAGGIVTDRLATSLANAGFDPGAVYAGGFDAAPGTVQGLKDDYLIASIDQQQYLQGYHAISTLYLLNEFGLTPNIDTGGYLITKDNLGLIEELSGTYR
ncbi:MAG: substrate-binding domain-containing protein [Caldilineales bacterium]|nr:substrate-binding domain-containing protein [Caldilineales bacterium]